MQLLWGGHRGGRPACIPPRTRSVTRQVQVSAAQPGEDALGLAPAHSSARSPLLFFSPAEALTTIYPTYIPHRPFSVQAKMAMLGIPNPGLCSPCCGRKPPQLAASLRLSVRQRQQGAPDDVAEDGEWQQVELPSRLQAIILVNIRSHAAGRRLWEPVPPPWEAQRHDDGVIEVTRTHAKPQADPRASPHRDLKPNTHHDDGARSESSIASATIDSRTLTCTFALTLSHRPPTPTSPSSRSVASRLRFTSGFTSAVGTESCGRAAQSSSRRREHCASGCLHAQLSACGDPHLSL